MTQENNPEPEPFTHADAAAFLRAGGTLKHCSTGVYLSVRCNSLMYRTSADTIWRLKDPEFRTACINYSNDTYIPVLNKAMKDQLCMSDPTKNKIDPLTERQRACVDVYRATNNNSDSALVILDILDTHVPDPRKWTDILAGCFDEMAKRSDSAVALTVWAEAAKRLRYAAKRHDR